MNETMPIEGFALAEAGRLMFNDDRDMSKRLKILGMMAGTYVSGLALRGARHSDGRLACAAYIYFRHIDDALDAEHNSYEDSQVVAEELPLDIATVTESKHPIAHMGRHVVAGLAERALPGDDPENDLQRLLDSMTADHHRALWGNLLFTNETEVHAYYDDMMRGVNIMLIGMRSGLRQDTDIPQFAGAAGHILSVRDLAADWQRGIYNIPRSVLNLSFDLPQTESKVPDLRAIQADVTATSWLHAQLDTASSDLHDALTTAQAQGPLDPGARLIAIRSQRMLNVIPQVRASIGRQ